MTVIYYMSIDRADKPWIGDRRFTERRARARAVVIGRPAFFYKPCGRYYIEYT